MKSTVNVGMFHGGHNTNVVPSACTVEIDRRLLPDEKVKDAFKELKARDRRRRRAEEPCTRSSS